MARKASGGGSGMGRQRKVPKTAKQISAGAKGVKAPKMGKSAKGKGFLTKGAM